MASQFKIQVVHIPTGQVVEWAPGLAVEKDFIVELANRVVAKGVGVGRTSTHVKQDVMDACEELLFDLKKQVG